MKEKLSHYIRPPSVGRTIRMSYLLCHLLIIPHSTESKTRNWESPAPFKPKWSISSGR